ncbi:MAG TPA: cadmium resistance transporter [Burkholderiales bacterium]|nr:cadmium resistance transporter [Burkholderiales bacterium]
MGASVAAGVAAFAATNLDDLFLLVAWFAAGRYRTATVVAGQFAGIAALFGLSAAASLLAWVVPGDQVAWLGVLPIGLGLHGLLTRNAHRPEAREAEAAAVPASGALAVALVTVANGADNLAVYVPLFATSSATAVGIYAAVFAAMTALWCAAARWLVRHPDAGAPLRRLGPRAVPYVLIGIGVWILLR